MEGCQIKLLEKKDCPRAAALRLAAHEQGFLPAMGLPFQIEILKATCKSKWGFGIVCVGANEEIRGMLYAATRMSSYYKSIFLRRGHSLAFWATLKILQRPTLLRGLLQYLVYPNRVPFRDIEAEWLTLVVDEKHRGKGIANALTLALIEEYRIRGIQRFKSTVAKNNLISCRLHETFGFNLLGTFTFCDDEINIYERDVTPAPATSQS